MRVNVVIVLGLIVFIKAVTAIDEIVVVEECSDDHDQCSNWTANGECSTNPFLMKMCKLSCKECEIVVVEECSDDHDQCSSWTANYECSTNPFLMKMCKLSCNACEIVVVEECSDDHDQCSDWTANYECSTNPFLMKMCKLSCNACGVPTAGQELIFNSTEIIVNPNETIHLDCGITGNLFSTCFWNTGSKKIQLLDVKNNNHGGIRPSANTEGNQCGIVVKQATIKEHGIWTCNIGMLNESINVIVTATPENCTVSPEKVDVKAGNTQKVICSAVAARPAAEITWTLNGIEITSGFQNEVTDSNKTDDTYTTISTLSRVFNLYEKDKNLQCVIAHHTYSEPQIIPIPINVRRH